MNDEAKLIEEQYKQGLNYHKQMGYDTKYPEYARFKEGDQWPAATENTKNLPRPVVNIIRFILNHKIAQVINETIKMIFKPEEVPEDEENIQDENMKRAVEGADKYSKAAENTWENVKQDELNEEALEDAATTGTMYYHYYWDTEQKGGITTPYNGNIGGEVIDPLNIVYGNPKQRRVQKQPYIIISSEDTVSNVKEYAISNGVSKEIAELITADNNKDNQFYDAEKVNVEGLETVTILTKYFKEQGRVYFIKVASGVVIKPKTDLGMGSMNGFRLYPIASMQWERKKKSAKGVSEIEGLIPNQKAINFNIAMLLLSVQESAWPKIIAKVNALNQQITNKPGEIITDYSQTPGVDGIKFMQPPNLSNFPIMLADKITEFTRVFTGVNEVAAGEPFTKDLNAAAIIAMQKQASIPIEQIKKRFYRCMEDVGQIWAEFYRVKYNLNRRISVKDAMGKETSVDFKGSDYEDIPMKLKIDIGTSSNYSEALEVTTLDKFLDKGIITPDEYIELAPRNVIPFRERLKQMREARKEAEMNKMLELIPPEYRQQFMMMSPEEQQQMMQQMSGSIGNTG